MVEKKDTLDYIEEADMERERPRRSWRDEIALRRKEILRISKRKIRTM